MAKAWDINSGSYACCIVCSSGDSRVGRVNSKQHAASFWAAGASRDGATRYSVDGAVHSCARVCALPCEPLMPSAAQVTVLGSGDAFGSGGRLNSAYLVESPGATFMVDCGTTVLQGLKRSGVDPARIDFICLSHLHGDHFGGVPFLFMD